MSPADTIAAYSEAQDARSAAICAALRKAIDTGLPGATAKIWHAIPVWFIGENPVVGYTARPKGVSLMFWNGQSFDERSLEAVGRFKAAQIVYTDVSQISSRDMTRWLKQAKSDIWDLVGLRKKTIAKKKRAAA
jgi:hypothetical protein